MEPEPGQYNWSMIDKALRTAAERGQTLMLRIPPYSAEVDVPVWYRKMVEYIFGQALKWHISSFNAKSSAVPEVWSPLVNEWLNKMGYRFVLRRFTYPSIVKLQGQLPVTSWWENKGVAPIYKDYKFAVRLKNPERTEILSTCAYLPGWLPGDIVYDEILYIPHDMPAGTYKIQIALVSPVSYEPRVKLAIAGVNEDGWYPMGEILVQNNNQ